MLKRLFRIVILIALLFGLSRYTSIFDNTEIKPYFDKMGLFIQDLLPSFGTGEITKSEIPQTGKDIKPGITGANSFEDADILENDVNMDIEDVAMTGQDLSTGTTITGSAVDTGNTRTTGQDEPIIVVDKPVSNGVSETQIASCLSPRGRFIPDNGYIIAYESTSSEQCKREKRYCRDGRLEGSYQYDTCYYTTAIANQQQSSFLNAKEIQSLMADYGSFGIAVSDSADNTSTGIATILDKQSGPGVIISSIQSASAPKPIQGGFYENINPLNKSVNDPDKHYVLRIVKAADAVQTTKSINILANGQTELNNNALKSRSLKKQLPGGGDTYYSNQKSFTVKNAYERKFCVTPRGSLISNGQYVTAFHYSQAVNGSCELETRFCIDGMLQGSFVNPYCEGPYPTLVTNMVHGAAPIDYIQTKNSIKNSLDSINLESSDKNNIQNDESNNIRFCHSTLFGTVPQGESIVAYNSRCKAEFRICNMGSLQGSFLQYSCQE